MLQSRLQRKGMNLAIRPLAPLRNGAGQRLARTFRQQSRIFRPAAVLAKGLKNQRQIANRNPFFEQILKNPLHQPY